MIEEKCHLVRSTIKPIIICEYVRLAAAAASRARRIPPGLRSRAC
jgi:hypothetical protein